jgi:single-strand DNA-binding protein
MSGSLNMVQLIGHLGADPDIRHTADGRPIANFSVATSEQWRDKASGEKKERTEWHRVVIFSEGLSKVAEQYLKKGSKVYLCGQLATRKWTDNAGVERYTTEVVLKNFSSQLTLLDRVSNGPPPAGSPDDYGKASGTSGAPKPGALNGGKRDDMDDEIPF